MTSVVVTKARASSLSESIQPVIDQEMAIVEINGNNIIIVNQDIDVEVDNKLCIKCNRFIVEKSKFTIKAKEFSLNIDEMYLDENSSITFIKK